MDFAHFQGSSHDDPVLLLIAPFLKTMMQVMLYRYPNFQLAVFKMFDCFIYELQYHLIYQKIIELNRKPSNYLLNNVHKTKLKKKYPL